MKHVIVPLPIKITDPENKKPVMQENAETKKMEEVPEYTLQRFHSGYVLSNPELGTGIEGLRRAVRLEEMFEKAVPGDVVAVDNEDHKVVMDILKKIRWPSPRHAMQFLPHLDAWDAAEKQDEKWKREYDEKKAAAEKPIEAPLPPDLQVTPAATAQA